jgi:hypothetical protein
MHNRERHASSTFQTVCNCPSGNSCVAMLLNHVQSFKGTTVDLTTPTLHATMTLCCRTVWLCTAQWGSHPFPRSLSSASNSCLSVSTYSHPVTFHSFCFLSCHARHTSINTHTHTRAIEIPLQSHWQTLYTPGSEGLGKATAAALAKRGLNIILVSRSQQKLDSAAAEIRSQHPGVEVRGTARSCL